MSEIRISNTLTGQKELFGPLTPGTVNMYTCGVTVYDHCHVGHARSLYVFEVIRRYLSFRGYKVTLVRNITDVDDKIINRAREWAQEQDISLEEAFEKVRTTYIDSYYEDLKLLGIPQADAEPKATENIEEMQHYIGNLIEKGVAYEKEGNVYFSVRTLPHYGVLSGKKIDDLLDSVRIEKDPYKRDPLDFALWKKTKPEEPAWDSPWGKGRPGWHIECSVMSQRYLHTDTLDIHGGGVDLVFPHHENELAQSEALTGKQFAKYWIHHGLLTINGQKMAKSLGNFFTIKDVVKKYPADILKLFYLGAHYSSPIDFSWEKMKEAKTAYERIKILHDKLQQQYGKINITEEFRGGAGNAGIFKQQFIEAMDDDFNMPRGLAVLFDMVTAFNKTLDSDIELKDFILKYALEIMQEIAHIFCLDFFTDRPLELSEKEIEAMIEMRAVYKKQKNFEEADKVREELLKQGIILEDGKDGKTTWRRKL
ncbi:MAG: cysteine--tRNA ligase [Candidatus Omnitrophica bacterium]|nr:cysteine--tRNA ligase [Candidatus Omnitrophota bacterium]